MSESVCISESSPADLRVPWQQSVLMLYCAALFLGAFMLFTIQPMFTKMVLPLLGGTPAVWNTALMFFQAMLLAGYLYAHLLSRLSGLRRQVLVHAALLAAGLVFLPVGVVQPGAPSGAHPVFWLVTMLTISIGLPFLAVSATAPLLQRWFSHSGHPRAADPYFLYVSSNVGGLGALLVYPVLIEPLFGLSVQSWAWMAGYTLLALSMVLCAISLRALRQSVSCLVPSPVPDGGERIVFADRITWRRRGHWLVLSFVPSALLLAVTQHISTDVAAVPFLWVVPLSLYMLTFVIVFARRPVLRHSWMLAIQIPLYALLAIAFTQSNMVVLFALDLAALFVTAMVCHGELVRHRPAAERLTEFYLWMSLGGLLGGVFCVLVAPLVFNFVLEYPLILAVALLVRPGSWSWGRRPLVLDGVLPAVVALSYSFVQGVQDADVGRVLSIAGSVLVYLVLAVAFCLFRKRPLRLALAFAVILFGTIFQIEDTDLRLYRQRSFFGVYAVYADPEGILHSLYHGNIIHGDQYMDEETIRTPTSYYNREGPLGQVFEAMRASRPVHRVGCVGLGTGTTACYQEPGQEMTFFEVDPAIVRIARDARLFRHLELARPEVDVALGDGRLGITNTADGTFDLIILDAFSSDAIPVHLLTREALAIYMRKLAPGGIVLFHISNRYMNLEPVLANVTADAGCSALVQDYDPEPEDSGGRASRSTWVVVGRDDADLEPFEGDDRWCPLEPDPAVGLWTDDYSNIFRTLMWDELLRMDWLH